MDKRELFQIGEVARMFHLSAGTLRHYEKIGLLQPERVDAETGYRYYSVRQFECLNTIRYLRLLGMPLEQIADFLKNRDVEKIRDMLRQQKQEVVRQQRQLQSIERRIDNRLAQLEDALSAKLDTPELVQTPPRRIAWLRDQISPHSYLDLEPSIRQLERQKQAVVFLGKVGVGIAEKRLIQRQYDGYDFVFLLLDDEDDYEGTAELLPACECARIRFCGNHSDAPGYYAVLDRFLSENKRRIAGFSREVTMIDDGFTTDPSRFVTEICIPVEPV